MVVSMLILGSSLTACSEQSKTLLSVGYDVSRDFYKSYDHAFMQNSSELNPLFISKNIEILQSFAASGKQAIAVKNGLQADVVTLNQLNDVELLVDAGLVEADWQKQHENLSMPFSSAMVLLVRKGNPKQIKGWGDLGTKQVKVLFANPKTSGSGRYAFLSLIAYAQQHFSDDKKRKAYLTHILSNIPLLDAGARAATISFTTRGLGDVLITAENEALSAAKILGKDKFEIIYPQRTVQVPVWVAEISANTKKHANSQLVEEYINGLWSDKAQNIAAQNFFRPMNQKILSSYKEQFPRLETFDVNQEFGSWKTINQKYFSDGAMFDTLYQLANKEKYKEK